MATFYSYKGGVGRTMALLNCAVTLAQRKLKVLVVDFDLEAPGIPTYDAFSVADKCPGIVDFVDQYQRSLVAPEIGSFLYECKLGDDEGNSVWVLPAGRGKGEYASKLAGIDWSRLYSEQSGYLLFEDLKQQLSQDPHRFDYVLIDSRTGHTDVGGICTRQLPNTVVVMFVPTMQNIVGLEAVVDGIRSAENGDGNPINLVFCPSNVPDLDDEHEILKRNLNCAKERLGYEEDGGIIHHYSSLALIDQSIFTLHRPRSRLSQEYRALATTLASANVGDRVGALSRIASITAAVVDSGERSSSKRIAGGPLSQDYMAELSQIGQVHSKDGEIALRLARAYRILGSLDNELEALNWTINLGYRTSRARFARALNYLGRGQLGDAVEDTSSVVASKQVSSVDLSAAIELLSKVDPQWFPKVAAAPALTMLRPSEKLAVSRVLASEREGLALSERLLLTGLEGTDDAAFKKQLSNEIILVRIGNSDFEGAIDELRITSEEVLLSSELPRVFNFAMADWGMRGQPSARIFERVVALSDRRLGFDPNYNQCMSLTWMVLGDWKEGASFVNQARETLGASRAFSCWSYLYRDRLELLRELEFMMGQISRQECRPLLFDNKRLH